MFVPYVIQAVIVYVGSRKNGFALKPYFSYSEDIKTMLLLIVPYFLSSLVIEINSLVDRYFASTLQSGTVSSINYASILNSFFVNVFSIAIVTILYPRLAAAAVSRKEEQYANDLSTGIKLVSFLFIGRYRTYKFYFHHVYHFYIFCGSSRVAFQVIIFQEEYEASATYGGFIYCNQYYFKYDFGTENGGKRACFINVSFDPLCYPDFIFLHT